MKQNISCTANKYTSKILATDHYYANHIRYDKSKMHFMSEKMSLSCILNGSFLKEHAYHLNSRYADPINYFQAYILGTIQSAIWNDFFYGNQCEQLVILICNEILLKMCKYLETALF